MVNHGWQNCLATVANAGLTVKQHWMSRDIWDATAQHYWPCWICIVLKTALPRGYLIDGCLAENKWKRPRLCTYRLNWARITSRRWWDEWEDTALQTQDSKFKPSRSVDEHDTCRSQRLPTILSFTSGWGSNILVLSNHQKIIIAFPGKTTLFSPYTLL